MSPRTAMMLRCLLLWMLLMFPTSIIAFSGFHHDSFLVSRSVSRKEPRKRFKSLRYTTDNSRRLKISTDAPTQLYLSKGDNHGDTSALPVSLVESFDRASFPSNQDTSSAQKSLVQKGLDFEVYRRNTTLLYGNISLDNALLSSTLDRVPGCIATVHVQTVLVPMSESTLENNLVAKENSTRYRVCLNGTSDAMLSRGLLACLSAAVAGRGFSRAIKSNEDSNLTTPTAHDVLQMDPESVSTLLGLQHVLSKGRNDGLANMMRMVQEQIQGLLSNENNGCNNEQNAEEVESVPTSTVNGERKQKTVAMLLSGGVDSSVALNMLKRDGYKVTAFYLKIWLEDELAHLGQCPWEEDYLVCQQVCQQAGVPLETISLQEQYKERVIAYTVNEAQRGRTPNPDVICNSRVKFGCFYNAIETRCFDHVASGHYAQLLQDDGENGSLRRLLRAPDPVKDQSYFLCALTQEQLKRVLFPIGHLHKSEVRQLADDFDLPNRHRPDSQGLCFLGKVKFDEFLAAYLGEQPGPIVDAATGDVLGQHKAIWYHTVGQRKGIGKVLNPQATSRGPWYVVAKDPERNIVFVSNQYDEDVFTAARSDFYIEDVQWIRGEVPLEFFERSEDTPLLGSFQFKIRHGPKLVDGTLEFLDKEGHSGHVRLDTKDGGLAPGQFVVVYNGNECLGGGVISERHWAKLLLDQEEVVGKAHAP